MAQITQLQTPSEARDPRVLPHNLQAEQALLGSLLVDNRSLEKISEFLKAEFFYSPVHGRIYDAIVRLCERGQIADVVTLKGYFEKDDELEHVGGATYLADLATAVVTTLNVYDYAQMLHQLHVRRQLISLGQEVVNRAFEQSVEDNPFEQIESVEHNLYNLAQAGEIKGNFISFRDSLATAIEMAEHAFKSDSHITGLSTGLRDMDKKLAGFHKSDLLILAGRPSMGKTSLATNIAYNVARKHYDTNGEQGGVVGFFSLEMSADQLATRVMADVARIPSYKIRRGDIRPDEFQKFVEASQLLTHLPLFIDDTPALTISALRTRARRLKRQHGLDVIVVDYLQLLRGPAGTSDNRVNEVSEITRGLKALAKELNIPVLALSQLSRAVESRDDKRPQLSDLRESGSIEQDADAVMFVFRQEYYLAREEPTQRSDEDDGKFQQRYAKWQERLEKALNIAECIIAKQRHGPIGTVQLHFEGEFTKFSDLEQYRETA